MTWLTRSSWLRGRTYLASLLLLILRRKLSRSASRTRPEDSPSRRSSGYSDSERERRANRARNRPGARSRAWDSRASGSAAGPVRPSAVCSLGSSGRRESSYSLRRNRRASSSERDSLRSSRASRRGRPQPNSFDGPRSESSRMPLALGAFSPRELASARRSFELFCSEGAGARLPRFPLPLPNPHDRRH